MTDNPSRRRARTQCDPMKPLAPLGRFEGRHGVCPIRDELILTAKCDSFTFTPRSRRRVDVIKELGCVHHRFLKGAGALFA
mmetsp:Transcript_36717/g.110213  ORF Transcript_36717/g.110213 Transcript_36717/m.110213 type:complete len:81 (+) Transcript_36717:248-490(+)